MLAGAVSNYPGWPVLFALSAVVILLTLPFSAPHPDLSRRQWIEFSAIGAAGAMLIVLQGHQFALISRHGWEVVWAVLVLAQASVVYLLLLSTVVRGTPPEHLDLGSTLDLLRKRSGPAGGPPAGRGLRPWVQRHMAAAVSVNRLVGFTLALIALMGLCVDPRYRSFNNCGFLLPALGYAWFARHDRDRPARSGGLERLAALVLTAGALGVLIQETPVNRQADVWVGICLLLAYPLWREGRRSPLRPLLGSGLALAGALTTLTALRYLVLHSKMVVALCTADPEGVICQVRAVLGLLMYHQVFGLVALGLALMAFWRGSAPLSLAAMIVALGALVFYNAGMGAVAFVLAGLILGHRKLARAGA